MALDMLIASMEQLEQEWSDYFHMFGLRIEEWAKETEEQVISGDMGKGTYQETRVRGVNSPWFDDTGSARASLTAFIPLDKWDIPRQWNMMKNHSDPKWVDAYTGKTQSRWLSLYPQNTPRHYTPQLPPYDAPPAGLIMRVAFGYQVEYGGDLEEQFPFLDYAADTFEADFIDAVRAGASILSK